MQSTSTASSSPVQTSGAVDERAAPNSAPTKASATPVHHLPWIPIRSLSPRQRPRIVEHLTALSPHDRYLRFGYQADDVQIGRYVDGLDFDRDEVFGVFNRRLELIAMAHLAYPPSGTAPGMDPHAAEFGCSVNGKYRGRGYGARLFEHAMLHSRNRGLSTIFIHALSENVPMLRIAKNAGATLHRDGPESDAYLELPPETLASHLEQAITDGAAEFDYRFKQQARLVDAVVDAISDVRSGIQRSDTGPREERE
jgi:RimJ/RimL family protein N-acetyltransferase